MAALLVGASLVGVDLVDEDFAHNLSEEYGWPIAYGFSPARAEGHSRLIYAAAMAADLVISAALLASTCATTQIAACLLVRSPRLNVRHLGLAVVLSALFLAGCRLKDDFLMYVLYAGFYYGVASLLVLISCVLLRLELPGRDDPPGGD